jgi:hypothetical protein
MLSNILPFRLTKYVDKITGDHQPGFDVIVQLLIEILDASVTGEGMGRE